LQQQTLGLKMKTGDTFMIAFISAHSTAILGTLLAISEGLALIPSLKSNSILQMVITALKNMEGSSDTAAKK
jgi:hypothetical protein